MQIPFERQRARRRQPVDNDDRILPAQIPDLAHGRAERSAIRQRGIASRIIECRRGRKRRDLAIHGEVLRILVDDLTDTAIEGNRIVRLGLAIP